MSPDTSLVCIPLKIKEQSHDDKVLFTRLNIQYCKTLVYARLNDRGQIKPYDR